jgi:hypothetical protein
MEELLPIDSLPDILDHLPNFIVNLELDFVPSVTSVLILTFMVYFRFFITVNFDKCEEITALLILHHFVVLQIMFFN